MNYKNRINRLTSILTQLSDGHNLSTPKLAKEFEVTNKIIQTDFKEYLLPLFDNDTIYYDYSIKAYKSKNNFLLTTFLDIESLAIIAIVKNKSQDKYSDENLYEKVNNIFLNYEENKLSSDIYQLSNIEKIDKFKKEITLIYNAMTINKSIKCEYKGQNIELSPLQIKEIDKYWYLLCYNIDDMNFRKYRFNSITKVSISNKTFDFDSTVISNFDNAINEYYNPKNKPIKVELSIKKELVKYLNNNLISKVQTKIKEYEDGSYDIELFVTDFMEIIPTIQKHMPYIGVNKPDELKKIVKSNLFNYLRNFD